MPDLTQPSLSFDGLDETAPHQPPQTDGSSAAATTDERWNGFDIPQHAAVADALVALVRRSVTDSSEQSVRRTISLPANVAQRVRVERARRSGGSISDVVIEAVDTYLVAHTADLQICAPRSRGKAGTTRRQTTGQEPADSAITVAAPLSWWRAAAVFCAAAGTTQDELVADAVRASVRRAR